jgi:hypothetical protein
LEDNGDAFVDICCTDKSRSSIFQEKTECLVSRQQSTTTTTTLGVQTTFHSNNNNNNNNNRRKGGTKRPKED